MTSNTPARSLVWQQVHMQDAPAAAGANHSRLLFETIFFYEIKHATF